MGALQHVHVPGYSALCVRRTYADLALPGAIMDRAKAWLIPQGIHWNEKEKCFTFPSGAKLTFGYCDTDQDVYRYQSAEFQFVAFDELTQFSKRQYTYLLSRLRRGRTVDIPLMARAASNPGGFGHVWVFERFVEHPDEDHAFVPATLEDNPHIDQASYRANLEQLDEVTKRQLLYGDWMQDTSTLVYKFDAKRNVAPLPDSDRPWTTLLGIDFGVRDATAFVIVRYRDEDPCVYVVQSWKQRGMSPSEAGEVVTKMGEDYRFSKIVGDLGGLGKAFGEEMRKRFSIPIEPAQKQNKLGYISLLNGAFERREILLVPEMNRALAKELSELPWKDETRQAESPGFDNHLTDALLYIWRACPNYHERAPAPRPMAGTKAHYDQLQREIESQMLDELDAEKSRSWWET